MIKRVLQFAFALAVGAGVVVGTIWVLTRTLGDHEPHYQGKTLEVWTEQIHSSDSQASNQAKAMLDQVLLPALTRQMFTDTNDSSLRLTLVEKLNLLPGVWIQFTPADGRRAAAAAALGDFGPPAQSAIPALTQALKGQDAVVRGPAALALGQIHSQPGAIIPLLAFYLDDLEVVAEVAEALGNYGTLARAVVPKLLPLAKIPDKELHRAVLNALKQIDPEAAARAGVK